MSQMLRGYLREVLEKEKKPDRTINDALDMGLALYEVDNDGFFVLYDSKSFLRSLNDESVDVLDVIYGTLGLDIKSGGCNNAGEIVAVAGQKGYGKLMYAIADTVSPNGIFSDRKNVSNDAKNFWKNNVVNKYQGKPFDDESRPQTPPKEDDCFIKHTKDNEQLHPLDKSYKLNANVNIEKLKANHEKVMSVVHHVKHSRKDAQKKLLVMNMSFFGKRLG